MKQIPLKLKTRITDQDPKVREDALWQLRQYPGKKALQLFKDRLGDDHAQIRYAAAAGIIAAGDDTAARTVIPLLRSQDPQLRNTAVEILAKIGVPAIESVIELVHDRDKDIRKFGVDILEQIGSKEAETTLVHALMDENVNVAAAAAVALGKCGTLFCVPHLMDCLTQSAWIKCAALRSLGAIGGDKALNAILALSFKEESMVLFSAVAALGTLGDPRGVDFLLTLLDQGHPALETPVMQAIESIFNRSYLQKINQVSQKIQVSKILPMLKSENSETVKSAVGLLGLLRSESSVEALVNLFTESNRNILADLEQAILQIKPHRIEPLLKIIANKKEPDSVRLSAVRIVGSIGRSEALEPLVSLLETAGEALRIQIITAICALKDPKAVTPLKTLLTDPSEQVRLSAIEALETFGLSNCVPALMNLNSDPSSLVRIAAARSLSRYDMAQFEQQINLFLDHNNTDIICFGLNLLSPSTGPDFEKKILGLCRHKDQKVRSLAIIRAGDLKSKAAIKWVLQAFSDTDESVRLSAVRAVSRKNDSPCLDALIKTARSDPSEWNRYEAVQAIGRLGLKQSQPRLISLLKTCPDIVKAAVLDIFGEWGHKGNKKIIKSYLNHDNELVRNAALEAMGKFKT